MRNKIRHFGWLLRKSFRLYARNFLTFFKISFVFYVFNLLMDAVYWNNGPLQQQVILRLPKEIFLFIDSLVLCFMVGAWVWYSIFLIKHIAYAESGRRVLFNDSVKEASAHFISVFLVLILYVLKVLGWSVLLIIPGFVFGTFYAFCGFACVLDGKQKKEALEYSRRLIQPNFNKFLDYTFFLFIFLYAVLAPFILTLDLMVHKLFSRGYFGWAKTVDFFEFLIIIIVSAVPFVFYFYLYHDLKESTRG